MTDATIVDTTGQPYKLGRIYKPDYRDTDHYLDEMQFRRFAAVQKPARAKPWRIGKRLNQRYNSCVVNAYYGFRQAAPFYCADAHLTAAKELADYHAAQAADEIPEPPAYEGTTANGMMKVARQRGEVVEWKWVPKADGEDVAREWLKTRGTLLCGTDWPEAFFNPGKHGYVEPADATKVGDLGHETLLRWYYGPQHYRYPDTYEFVNSWGAAWGDNGLFRMKADVFRWLVFQLNGDLCSPIEAARMKAMATKRG